MFDSQFLFKKKGFYFLILIALLTCPLVFMSIELLTELNPTFSVLVVRRENGANGLLMRL